MRKWTAIWMLAARAQGPWALAAILISTALVAAAFFLAAPEGVAAAGGVEATVADSACALASGLGLAALCAALALPLSDLFGTRPGLTLLRLRVGERAALLHIAGFDAACLLMLWAAHASVLFLLAAQAGEAAAGLAFLREGYLHSLLPVADPPRLARNAVLCLSLGIAAARFPAVLRRGRKPLALPVLLCATLLFFSQEMGEWGGDVALGGLAALIAASQIYALYAPEEEGGEAA